MGKWKWPHESLGELFYRDDPAAPSEQKYVRELNAKLRNDGVEARIDRDELRRFATVYPRLYQLPPRSRARLEAWRSANWAGISPWDVDHFWCTAEEDAHFGRQVRAPGIPEEAKPVPDSADDEEQATVPPGPASEGDNAGDTAGQEPQPEPEPAPSRSQRVEENQAATTITTSLPRGRVRTGDPAVDGHLLSVLDFVDYARVVGSELECISTNLEHDDPLRGFFSGRLGGIAARSQRAEQAIEAVAELLKAEDSPMPPAASGARKRGRQAAQDSDGLDDDEDEEARARRIRAARERTVAEIELPDRAVSAAARDESDEPRLSVSHNRGDANLSGTSPGVTPAPVPSSSVASRKKPSLLEYIQKMQRSRKSNGLGIDGDDDYEDEDDGDDSGDYVDGVAQAKRGGGRGRGRGSGKSKAA